MVPKVSVTGLGDYTRNVDYKTGSIDFSYETKTFNYDRGIRLTADSMDMEKAGVLDCFVQAGTELQRTQVALEAVLPSMKNLNGGAIYPIASPPLPQRRKQSPPLHGTLLLSVGTSLSL